MRMVLHLARPGGCRRALVVLRRHLASGARAPGGVTATPAAHAAQVTRRRAARHGTSASCNTNANREPPVSGPLSQILSRLSPSHSSRAVAHAAARAFNGTSVVNCINSARGRAFRARHCVLMHLVAVARRERVSRMVARLLRFRELVKLGSVPRM